MIKLLGIIGSSRKGGNTETIIKEVLKASEQEGAETELLYLVDFTLEPCNGCRTCWDTKECIIKDDAEKILNKMKEFDGIVIGSPVYFYNINSQTKTFIDRVGYLNYVRGRPAFKNKVGGAVVVAGRSGLMNSLSQILLFLTASRMIVASPVVAAIGSGVKGDVINDTSGVEYAKELGTKMVQIAKITETLRKN